MIAAGDSAAGKALPAGALQLVMAVQCLGKKKGKGFFAAPGRTGK